MKSAVALSATVAILSGTTDAFWRMGCRGRTALARLDPIVDNGTASTHVHAIHGGNNFGMSTTYDQLRESDCSSCQFSDDKSAYWTPSLHFVDEKTGKVQVVPQKGGMIAYYQLNGQNLKAFPAGFQMIAGDTRMRNFSGPTPDRPLAAWTASDRSQSSLAQKSLGFNCLNYKKAVEGSRYRHVMPDKKYLDDNCDDGLRAELFFPSCWNGKDKTADDHKSHMAYPSMIDGGVCPEGFPVRTASLFYETIWDTTAFKGKNGQFVWSNGDPTGCGYHGDFMNGWDIDTLQSAITTCTNESGLVEDCKVFAGRLQDEAKMGQCKVKELPEELKNDDPAGPAKGLCGEVPIQYGPEYASALKPGDVSNPVAPVLSSVSLAVPSYAPARSVVNGISVYNVKTDAAVVAAAPTPAAEKKPEAPAAAPAPAITPAPAPAAPQDGKKIISTSVYTSAGVVYEIAIEEVAVTTTVTEGYKQKHRRHAHAEAHMRKRREHGLAQ